MTGKDSMFSGSAYLLGAATGVVLMVPLTAASLATGSMERLAPHPVAIEAFGPGAPSAAVQAPQVNRAAKGPRLDHPPSVVTNGPVPVAPTPSRATRTPKGCLSAIGVTKSSLSTEELTVCVADASMIENIN